MTVHSRDGHFHPCFRHLFMRPHLRHITIRNPRSQVLLLLYLLLLHLLPPPLPLSQLPLRLYPKLLSLM